MKSKKPALKVGKRYTAVRSRGPAVTGKLVSIDSHPNGEWATLAYSPEGAKRGVTASLKVRPSALQAA